MDFKDLKPNTFYTRVVDSGFDVFTFKNTYDNSYLVCDVAFRKNWSICNVSGVRLSTPEEQHWLEECIKKDEFIPKDITDTSFKKETNYIVGKWYKTKMGSFVKYSRTTSDGIFESSEFIDFSSHTYSKRAANYGRASNTGNFTEAILNEFEKYLPDGHPDKTENVLADMGIPDYIKNAPFKIGQKVKLKGTGSAVSDQENYGAKTGEIVTITKIDNRGGSASNKDPRYYGDNFNVRGYDLEAIDTKENDMDEILKECKRRYPIGTKYKCVSSKHIDRIYEVTSQSFRVPSFNTVYAEGGKGVLYSKGDYAEIINILPEYVKCIVSWTGFSSSKVGKIYDTSIPPDFTEKTWKNLLNCSLGTHFTPSTKEEFDISNKDTVENLKDILKICKEKYPIGTVFKEISSSNEYEVKEELMVQHAIGISHVGIPFVYLCGKYADIVKLPEKNTSKKETLKIGDIVVVTKQCHPSNVPEGNIGKLVSIDDSTVPYDVEWKETSSWCLNVRKATLAEERSYFNSKAKKEPAKDTSAEYKIGDWFFVQQNTTVGCRLTLGKVYQVQKTNKDIWVEAKEYGADGGQIFLKDIRKALPHEIPVQDSLAVPIPKKKVIISDIIEIKKLKTF